MKNSTKIQFSSFVLECLFKDIDTGFQNNINDIVMENCILLCKDATAGFVFDGKNYVHSDALAGNLEQQRLQRYQLDVLHPDLIDKVMELVESMSHKDIDFMRFKGMINGLLSVVKSDHDFAVIFDGMFSKEVNLFNVKYSTKLGKTNIKSIPVQGSPSSSSISYANGIKKQFEIQYNRYRFLNEILGI